MNRTTLITRAVWAAVAALSLCLFPHPGVAGADGPADEVRFVEVVRANLPYYVIPGGRFATDPQVLASGYRACAELDRSPTDAMRAARAFYPGETQPTARLPTTVIGSCSTRRSISASATRICTTTSDARGLNRRDLGSVDVGLGSTDGDLGSVDVGLGSLGARSGSLDVLRGRTTQRDRGQAEFAVVPAADAIGPDDDRDALVHHLLDHRAHLFGVGAVVSLPDADAGGEDGLGVVEDLRDPLMATPRNWSWSCPLRSRSSTADCAAG